MAKTTKTDVKVETTVEPAETVKIMVPYIEGEDPEVTVIINGHITKFKKGVTVDVPIKVAKVLENSNQQMMSALDNQAKFKKQVMDL